MIERIVETFEDIRDELGWWRANWRYRLIMTVARDRVVVLNARIRGDIVGGREADGGLIVGNTVTQTISADFGGREGPWILNNRCTRGVEPASWPPRLAVP